MTPTPTMSQEELALFNELFSNQFGLHFPDHKREILESRLQPRLRANHLQRFLDYYLLLQYDLRRELDPLTRAITNNESYFFRETAQLDALVAALEERRKDGDPLSRLRVLSAGCSAGEEPYTLNIMLREALPLALDALAIRGVDLDSERLEQARCATYRPGSLRALSPDQIERYFDRVDERGAADCGRDVATRFEGDPTYRLKERHRQGVKFSTGNLLDLTTLALDGRYDALFCRNVLIYFSEQALKKAIDNFAEVVRPGGLLFLGHSESIIGLTKRFQAERLGRSIAYRRTEEGG